jgi:hypothetical protein
VDANLFLATRNIEIREPGCVTFLGAEALMLETRDLAGGPGEQLRLALLLGYSLKDRVRPFWDLRQGSKQPCRSRRRSARRCGRTVTHPRFQRVEEAAQRRSVNGCSSGAVTVLYDVDAEQTVCFDSAAAAVRICPVRLACATEIRDAHAKGTPVGLDELAATPRILAS